MKPLFCFIDDAQFELDNFAANAAPGFAKAEFLYATTFAEAQAKLNGRLPLCFLLDIYGQDLEADEPAILEQAELELALGLDAPRAKLYEGLGSGPEAGNLFLRRLYGQVERWQRAFLRAAAALGQGRAYGQGNLAQVRQHYPWAAALGYSRKALYADAVALCQAGADGLLQKPQGQDDQAIARATRQAAPELARDAYAAVERRLAAQASALAARLCREGDSLVLAEALEDGARHLALADPAEPPRCELGEACSALAAPRHEDLKLAPGDWAVVLTLRQWLSAGE